MIETHLLVLVHGMWGNPEHLAELARIARETHGSETGTDAMSLHILVAETIREESTYDGADWGGERVASEVLEAVKTLEAEGRGVTRFSVTGYSLGGLIARYCIGVLHSKGFFEKIEPINFNTIATPHCGLPKYPSFLSTLSMTIGSKLLSRTGEQFYCLDKWSPKGRPLLVVMADPERVFHQALAKFKHIRVYANAVNDLTVPYVTAAIETSDPFAEAETNGIYVNFKEKYDCVIDTYAVPDVPPPKPPKPTILTAKWFKSLRPSNPSNLVLYSLLPLLIPTLVPPLLLYSLHASHVSQKRVKALELEVRASGQQKLQHILAELDREMEEAVVDLIDNPDPSPKSRCGSAEGAVRRAHPIITPTHERIALWLNALPIKKELGFFPTMINSHAVIICRDVKRFEANKLGEGVVRHWADSFIL
ncbi:hypothetical protein NLJ89_g10832 [Agrocybe chaxingu]|uniref:DUF676 domain-containing protein n=1 Tax=Agrocybe chaxingu TaxID=84603 RepID=A0A9W8JQD9_9AGAR|nr:hypothetical protein NLJ89_g10832 [Agrocybe chaxingu]